MTAQNVPPTKPASELQIGDWVDQQVTCANQCNAEIVAVYPFVTDDARARVLITYVRAGKRVPEVAGFYAEDPVRVLTAEEIAGIREQGERSKRIAEIRQLADWLERHPEAPMPYMISASEHLSREAFGDGTEVERLAKVRDLAASLGIKTDEHLEDRTRLIVDFGNARYELVAWHPAGRPNQPEATPDPEPPLASGRELSAADEATPTGKREPLHTGGVVDGGRLVDETPCYVPCGFHAPEVIAEEIALCAASHPGRECTQPVSEPSA